MSYVAADSCPWETILEIIISSGSYYLKVNIATIAEFYRVLPYGFVNLALSLI